MDCGKKRLKQDEQCVQDLIACMQEFDAFPFNPISPTLRTLQSAMPASSQLVSNFNSAYAAGEMKLMSFLKEWVYSKTTSIHTRVPLSKCSTFLTESCTENTKENLEARTAEIEQQALKAVINLVEVSRLVNLHELLEHRVVEECLALFNSNGTYRKTQKASLFRSSLFTL